MSILCNIIEIIYQLASLLMIVVIIYFGFWIRNTIFCSVIRIIVIVHNVVTCKKNKRSDWHALKIIKCVSKLMGWNECWYRTQNEIIQLTLYSKCIYCLCHYFHWQDIEFSRLLIMFYYSFAGNTISNVIFIIPSLLMLGIGTIEGHEERFQWCHFSVFSKSCLYRSHQIHSFCRKYCT